MKLLPLATALYEDPYVRCEGYGTAQETFTKGQEFSDTNCP